MIQQDEIRAVLDPLPVGKVFGVGRATEKRLASLGVTQIGQLAGLDRDEVVRRFGASGAWIHDLAAGIDPRRVNPRRVEKSHGMERTFAEDITDRDQLRRLLLEYSEEVAFVLRDRGLQGRTIAIKARFPNFKTVTRSKTLGHATNLGARIYATARELLERVPAGPLRLLGIQVTALEDVHGHQQGTLFDESPDSENDGRDKRLRRAMLGADRLRKKYGKRMVQPGSTLRKRD